MKIELDESDINTLKEKIDKYRIAINEYHGARLSALVKIINDLNAENSFHKVNWKRVLEDVEANIEFPKTPIIV